MAKSARSPFDVTLSDDQRTTIQIWLKRELDNAIAARAAQAVDVDYWWTLYEQGRTRDNRNLPWPDAADLTSYIPCEKVDAVHARLMRTIWVSPLATVEGWGQAANRAPFVEEFHQWKVEEERLQSVLDKLALNCLVEPRGLLEVYESSERRVNRKNIDALPEQTPQGGVVFGNDGEPSLHMNDQTGQYVEAQPNELAVKTVIDSQDIIRMGPAYRVLPYEDSLILPGHARDKEDIWGYAKRFWKRKPDLTADADNGIYDKKAVDQLTDVGDRTPTASMLRSGMAVVPEQAETAEKELWEALILIDLNNVLTRYGRDGVRGLTGDGARWYVATIHLPTGNLLRLNHDDFEKSRYVPFILFPRPDRMTEGYSFVGNKLLTVTEEHTAFRNMAADRSSMAVNAPILKVQGALWDEDEQPWGPKAVVTVRDIREISQMQVADVPQSVFAQIQYDDRVADRLAGVNDIASGQTVQGDKTLGEVQMATEQSFVRIDLIVRRFQEAMEDLFQIRHAIWKRVLSEQPTGVQAPGSMMALGREGGTSIDAYLPDGKVTAALLDGPFRFRPYGSVDIADPSKRRNDLLAFIAFLPRLYQAMPSLQAQFSSPQAARAIGREILQSFSIRNVTAFLGSPVQDMQQQTMLDQLPFPSAIPPPPQPPPGPPGMPPGMQPPGQQMMGGPSNHPPPPGPPPMSPGPAGPQ